MTVMQTTQSALREYQEIKTGSEVEDATPHRLIQLMMERALAKLMLARAHMVDGNIAEKGELIGAAMDIISALQQCLNYKADEKLAGNFDALYDYMLRRILLANLNDDPSIVSEVIDLLGEIKEAWDAIQDKE